MSLRDLQISLPMKHCSRMDNHPVHRWFGNATRRMYFCHGVRVHEGGFRHG